VVPVVPTPSAAPTTLRVGYYLVATKRLNAIVAADLARRVMAARRDLIGEEPSLSGLAAPCVLLERIRAADDEAQLRQIEQEVDGVLREHLARTAGKKRAVRKRIP
jgi:hypothetical protein